MATSYSPKVNTDGLIMCIDFANSKSYASGSTTTVDLARRISGSFAGQPTQLKLDDGRGLRFNQNQYLAIQTDHNSLTNATFIAWVNLPTASLNLDRAFWGTAESGSWGFQLVGINPQGNLYASAGKGSGPNVIVSSSIDVSDNKWHMITYQYSVGDKLYLYADTEKIIGPTFPSKGGQSTSSFIAGDYNNGNRRISGSIGMVMWYNRVLSDNEILQNFNATRNRFGV